MLGADDLIEASIAGDETVLDSVTAPAPIDQLDSIHTASKQLYWKRKSLEPAVQLMQKGIELGRTSSDVDVLGKVKAMCFDLASFCWPGWDEEGIQIQESHLAIGEQAANENLNLAVELGRPPLPMANAHWMVGAYHLSFGRLEEARESFIRQEELAEQAQSPANALLARGYLAIVDRMLGRADALDEVKSELRCSFAEEGVFFCDQLDTAARVLMAPRA